MSKERELLNKAIELIQIVSMVESIGKVSPDFGSELILEIQELLAQPVKYQFTTRLDQEPVMYQYRDKLDGKDWGRWNLCNKIDYEDYKNNPTFQHWTYQTRKLLAQPEPTAEPVAWMWDEMFCEDWTTVSSVIKPSKSKYVDNVRPLYLAPPKREPLINIYVLNAFKADDEATHPYSYWAGVEFAEKHHGIGGEE